MVCKVVYLCSSAVGLLRTVALVFAFSQIAVGADPLLQDELSLDAAYDRAMARTLESQRQLEAWRLEKLNELRAQGHASWLEVSRQGVVVERLEAHRQAAHELAMFLDEMRRRAQEFSTELEPDSPVPAAQATHVIRLSLPGSVRLIGWYEFDTWSAEVQSERAARRRDCEADVGQVQSERKDAVEKARRAEDRVRRLDQFVGEKQDPQRRKQAELELALARTETELADAAVRRCAFQLRQRNHHVSNADELAQSECGIEGASKGNNESAFPITEMLQICARCASHDTDPVLREAALRVAAVEVKATGHLCAAETALRERKLRLGAMEELRASGHASQSELDEAREQVEAAEWLLEQVQLRQATLSKSYEALALAADESKASTVMVKHSQPAQKLARLTQADARPSTVTPADLNRQFLANAVAVRHLVDLRRIELDALARARSLAAELALREEFARRLAGAGHESMSNRREQQRIDLEIAFHRAELLAVAERLEAVRLETVRFLQERSHAHAAHETCVCAVPAHHLASYVESPGAVRCAVLWRSSWLAGERSVARADLDWTDHRSPTWRGRLVEAYRARDSFLGHCPHELDLAHAYPCYGFGLFAPSYAFRVRTYPDEYAFGIRQFDKIAPPAERRLATPYGGPWYYPGATTNFR